jgi:hypothetical protein
VSQNLPKPGLRKIDYLLPADLELVDKLLICSRTNASNRLEDGHRSAVAGFETGKLLIQVFGM